MSVAGSVDQLQAGMRPSAIPEINGPCSAATLPVRGN